MNDTDKRIVETYNALFEGLSFQNKLELIESLSRSLKAGFEEKDLAFYRSFGAFPDDKSAEEIIKELKASRKFNTKDMQL